MPNMRQLIEDFALHLSDSQEIAESVKNGWSVSERMPQAVVITGLGGSGIGGTIAADYVSDVASVPVWVNKGYDLPAWVNANTHVIACSYSGNTEETLSALEDAMSAGAMVSAITSGGSLKALAESNGWNMSVVPGGNPPRSMFGYAWVQIMAHLEMLQIGVDASWTDDVSAAVKSLQAKRAQHLEEAESIADQLENCAVAVYAATGAAGVATRWRQQLNENSKMPAWDAEVPEMNHNEMVGWAGGGAHFAAVFLHTDGDAPRNTTRMQLNAEAIAESGSTVVNIEASGDSQIEQLLDMIALGDWVSYVLSERNGVDIMDIQVIDRLKEALSKL